MWHYGRVVFFEHTGPHDRVDLIVAESPVVNGSKKQRVMRIGFTDAPLKN